MSAAGKLNKNSRDDRGIEMENDEKGMRSKEQLDFLKSPMLG